MGSGTQTVTRALVVLDITPSAVQRAAECGAQLIISHHPVIFKPIKTLQQGSVPYLLAQHGISAICAHTNLDKAQGGVNDCLAAVLELTECTPFGAEQPPLGRMGKLRQTVTPQEFAEKVAKTLGVSVRWNHSGKPVSTVAVVGGAGGSYLYEAAAAGADALVTGEVHHHEYLDAAALGITVIDATHYATEQVVLQPLAEYLKDAVPQVEFLTFSGGDVLCFTQK